ncbi:protease B nonderepressible form [Cryomyces antarcticus]|uniref:Protein PBN1 n=1 Tax=Cryomyces antarcticus TaxID=329879 RepID=A0ABR0M7K0_9PEZI|nr:protease B nonderepressible form [Cryomyces antarcticus]KAK5289757.1 protease B nonderepressible form [Cryomyces antarcticus]
MKRRTTYLLHDANDGVDPKDLDVTRNSLTLFNVKAAKEERVTFALSELPREDTFTSLPILSERFSTSASSQYHSLQPSSLHDLVGYIQQKICPSLDHPCQDQAASLLSATYLDVDFDSISHALVLNAFWVTSPDRSGAWTETIQLEGDDDTIEVGVLGNEMPTEPEELSLSGFLTVIGEDDRPGATLFSFPSRHHPAPHSPIFHTTFPLPTGLHPTLQLTFPSSRSLIPPAASCALHTYLTLPAALFIDRYQFSDALFLRAHGLIALRSFAGEGDLEAPEWVVQKWGSAALFELAHPLPPDRTRDAATKRDAGNAKASAEDAWTVRIPLHARYMSPTNGTGGTRDVAVPWPAVFWACDAADGLKMSVNPFDRANLGYDGLFGPKTMFYHLAPALDTSAPAGMAGMQGKLVEIVKVPVMDLAARGGGYVELGTLLAVLAGFAWVLWKLVGVGWGGEGKERAAPVTSDTATATGTRTGSGSSTAPETAPASATRRKGHGEPGSLEG